MVYSEYKLREENVARKLAEKTTKLIEQRLELEKENMARKLAEKNAKLIEQRLELEKENTARKSAEKKEKSSRIKLLKNNLENENIKKSEYSELINQKGIDDIEMARFLIMGFNQKLNEEKSLEKAKKLLDKHKKSYSAKELLREYKYYNKVVPIGGYKEAEETAKKESKLTMILFTRDSCLKDYNRWGKYIYSNKYLTYKINKYFKLTIFNEDYADINIEDIIGKYENYTRIQICPTLLVIDPLKKEILSQQSAIEIEDEKDFNTILDEIINDRYNFIQKHRKRY